MMHPTLQLHVLAAAAAVFACAISVKAQSLTYSYADSGGNIHIVSRDSRCTLEYRPFAQMKKTDDFENRRKNHQPLTVQVAHRSVQYRA